MAIQSVQVQLNGTWHSLTYNSTSGKYEGQLTAPGQTSYLQPNHWYEMTVKATNTAGTATTVTGVEFPGLQLRVLEKAVPTIHIVSPGQGAYVTNSQQPILFQLRDEPGGSGVDLTGLTLTVDGGAAVTQTGAGMVCTAVTDGYDCTYTPGSALADGNHTVVIQSKDFDGNRAAAASRNYTQDTIPPILNISKPTDGFMVNGAGMILTGSTNDIGSSPVHITVKLNGADQGAVTVGADGLFSKSLTLANGANTIVVTATDSAGKNSAVTITGTLDTSMPQITGVTIAPNPVDAGASMVLKVTVTG